ncbi:hypothetical protein HEP87_63220 [Streptomyces sp. S1D4-11]|nr:hypothetical protein [Streptomyces sp. S1D4-11]
MTDELVVMHRGRVVERDSTDPILTSQEHPYTRDTRDTRITL